MKENSKPQTRNRLFAVRYFSEIGRKWCRHQSTGNGLSEADARALVKSMKEVKGEVVPYTPDKPAEIIPWLAF